MHRIFQNFVEGLRESSDAVTLQTVMARAVAAFDLHAFAYLALPSAPSSQTRLISTYPTSWTTHYLRERYEHVDPVIKTALTRDDPFEWGRDVASIELSNPQQQLFDEASEFGIRHGFTIPLRCLAGPVAALTFATDQCRPAFQRSMKLNLQALQLMSIQFHNHVRRKLDRNRIVSGVPLTERELQCLQWKSKGKSAWEIGQILGISRRTAAFHLDNARAKLGVRSVCQAVAKLASSEN